MRRAARMAGLLALLALALAAPALAATAKTTLNDVEDELMCVSCGVPLNIAQSPQADRERALIADLVARGLTKKQIKREMVAQYGERVIAQPDSKGFNVTNWLIPLAVVVALIAGVAVLLPRWRRREISAEIASEDAPPEPGAEDRRRLDEDLARYR